MNIVHAQILARQSGFNYAERLADEVDRLESQLALVWAEFREQRWHLRAELAQRTDDYHAQLEAVADLSETLAEERVQHAAQMERVRGELAGTVARIAAWDDALGDVVPELEQQMAPERPRLVEP